MKKYYQLVKNIMLIIYLRKKSLSTSNALAIDVYLDALKKLKLDYSYVPEEFIILQPTSPLRTLKNITECFELYKNKAFPSFHASSRDTRGMEI